MSSLDGWSLVSLQDLFKEKNEPCDAHSGLAVCGWASSLN